MNLVILDRDGVINQDSDEYIKNAEEWTAIDGSLEAIARLTQAGYHIIVVSNQSGLGRSRFNIDDLNRIHQKMIREISKHGGMIDAIFFCPHAPEDECYCRKPNPGLFDQIAFRTGIMLEKIPYIGDKLSDIEVAKRVGAMPILVRTGYGQACLDHETVPDDVLIFDSLSTAVDRILEQ